MERTRVAGKDHQETMVPQALKVRQDLKDLQALRDQTESPEAASIVHHQEPLQAIKLFLLLFGIGINFYLHHHHHKINL